MKSHQSQSDSSGETPPAEITLKSKSAKRSSSNNNNVNVNHHNNNNNSNDRKKKALPVRKLLELERAAHPAAEKNDDVIQCHTVS
jgi:hypothetical protein